MKNQPIRLRIERPFATGALFGACFWAAIASAAPRTRPCRFTVA
ncbi:hypothetical protein [Microbulbifer taiwanensis]